MLERTVSRAQINLEEADRVLLQTRYSHIANEMYIGGLRNYMFSNYMPHINIRLWLPLSARLTKSTEDAFLRRDSYLGHLLSEELPEITRELEGLTNSDAARRYISSRLEDAPRVSATLKLPPEVIDQLTTVCDAHNLVRDALFNRLVFLLTNSLERFAKIFEIDEQAIFAVTGEPVRTGDDTWFAYDGGFIGPAALRASSPFALVKQLLTRPLDLQREVIEVLKDSEFPIPSYERENWLTASLSGLSFQNVALRLNQPQLIGLNLYMPDSEIPGTTEYAKAQAESDVALKDFLGNV